MNDIPALKQTSQNLPTSLDKQAPHRIKLLSRMSSPSYSESLEHKSSHYEYLPPSYEDSRFEHRWNTIQQSIENTFTLKTTRTPFNDIKLPHSNIIIEWSTDPEIFIVRGDSDETICTTETIIPYLLKIQTTPSPSSATATKEQKHVQ